MSKYRKRGMLFAFVASALFMLSVLSSLNVSAAGGATYIDGWVKDSQTGIGLVGVKVSTTSLTTYTGADGSYRLSPVYQLSGTIVVTASAIISLDYWDQSITVTMVYRKAGHAYFNLVAHGGLVGSIYETTAGADGVGVWNGLEKAVVAIRPQSGYTYQQAIKGGWYKTSSVDGFRYYRVDLPRTFSDGNYYLSVYYDGVVEAGGMIDAVYGTVIYFASVYLRYSTATVLDIYTDVKNATQDVPIVAARYVGDASTSSYVYAYARATMNSGSSRTYKAGVQVGGSIGYLSGSWANTKSWNTYWGTGDVWVTDSGVMIGHQNAQKIRLVEKLPTNGKEYYVIKLIRPESKDLKVLTFTQAPRFTADQAIAEYRAGNYWAPGTSYFLRSSLGTVFPRPLRDIGMSASSQTTWTIAGGLNVGSYLSFSGQASWTYSAGSDLYRYIGLKALPPSNYVGVFLWTPDHTHDPVTNAVISNAHDIMYVYFVTYSP